MKKSQKIFLDTSSKSDKINHHGYHRFYPWFLHHIRDDAIKILEIGIDETESIKLWNEYFTDVEIHGIDIEQKKFDSSKVKLFCIDQSNEYQLEDFSRRRSLFYNLIIDDGSHVPSHQILTLKKLWPTLKPSGIYIIEDIETSYWGKSSIYGYNFNSRKENCVETLLSAVNNINSEFCLKPKKNIFLDDLADEIEMISFGQNCIILIKKDYQIFSKFYQRNYRFKKNINNRTPLNYMKRALERLLKFSKNLP